MFIANYTPQNSPVNAYKAAVQLLGRGSYKQEPWEGPVTFKAVFVMPRVKADGKTQSRLVHKKRPDIDNLFKSTTDALIGIIYKDDSQIWKVELKKVSADLVEQPCCEITIDLE